MHTSDTAAFLHSPLWEEFLRRSGNTVERSGDSLYIKGLLPGGGSYWRGSRINVTKEWQPPAFTNGSWFIRLEPLQPLPASLKQYGRVVPTQPVQPRQTVLLDITASEEGLLSSMKSKHRYNVRVAEKHGVTVELVHENAAEHFERFWKLLEETATRNTFRTHDAEHYKTMLEVLAPAGEAHLAFAVLNGEDCAALLLITHKNVATYLHGASTAKHRQVMAPNLLHWEVIRWAKAEGYETYDLWGTNAVQENDEWVPRANHASSGTTRFKLGFGGNVAQYPGAYDLVLKPVPYTLYSGIRRITRRQSSF